jgi:hypothetical protein
MAKPVRSSNSDPRIREDLLVGLQHLRSEAKEISRIHAANLQRDMVQLIDFISRPPGRVTRAKYARMKKTLDRIHVRPEKGRRKDLRRVEDAIRSMMKVAFSKNANG